MSGCCGSPGEDGWPDGVALRSVLRCPHCAGDEELEMPVDACRFFHECAHCQRLLRPRDGDCCVFCSYGSLPCPPIQAARGSSGAGDPA